jgi:hypothetical protein
MGPPAHGRRWEDLRYSPTCGRPAGRRSDVGNPEPGRAEVRIDGVRVAIVSESAATLRYRDVVFARTLAVGGRHTIEIRPLGNGRLDVDAFLTLP